LASRADVVATAAIVAVVDTTGIDGTNCSIVGTGSQIVSQINLSGVNLYSLTLSVPAAFRSPMRLALIGGHSISFLLLGVGGGSGGSISGAGASPTSTPSASGSS
tara:strand:+ start:4495 stop:4809 length:315 start_codon:yes stop_codon:yes gene_type:complete